jgi:sugar-specific transcriptional regulator TrmB
MRDTEQVKYHYDTIYKNIIESSAKRKEARKWCTGENQQVLTLWRECIWETEESKTCNNLRLDEYRNDWKVQERKK